MIVHHGEDGKVVEKDPSTVALFQWAEFLGISLNPKLIYPVSFPPGYLGIQTQDTLYPGEAILSAPNQSMLSTKYMNHPSLEIIYSAHPDLFSLPDKAHEENRMLTYFLWEFSKGTSSFWYTYFQYLPKDLETLVDWNDEELAELQDSDLVYHAKHKKAKDFTLYETLQKTLRKYTELFCEEDLEIDKIHWAWKIICTRSYSGKIPYTTLIPIADLFNHSNVNTNFFYGADADESPDSTELTPELDLADDDDPFAEGYRTLQFSSLKLYRLSLGPTSKMNEAQLKINNEVLKEAKAQDQRVFLQSNSYTEMTTATKNIDTGNVGEEENHKFRITVSKFEVFEPGAQVFIKYGKYSNAQLLWHYGFAMIDNIYNYARIKQKLKCFLNETQFEALGKGYSPDFLVVFKLRGFEFSQELLKTFRSFHWNININSAESFFNPSDIELEQRSIAKVLNFLEESFSAFPTTIEEDLEILTSSVYKKSFAVKKS